MKIAPINNMNIVLREGQEPQGRGLTDGRHVIDKYNLISPRNLRTPDTKPYHGKGAAPLSRPASPNTKPYQIYGQAAPQSRTKDVPIMNVERKQVMIPERDFMQPCLSPSKLLLRQGSMQRDNSPTRQVY